MKKIPLFILSSLVPLLPLLAQEEALKSPPKETALDLYNQNQPAFILSGELLFWTVNEGAVDYVHRMKTPAWSPTSSYAQGDVENANFDWDPGLRVGIGYYRAENFWEALAEYTYLQVEGKDQTKKPPEGSRFMTGTFPQIFTSPMQKATSHIQFHYQLADLLASRVFHPEANPHLRLRLIGGIALGWLHQDWKVRYFDPTNVVTTTFNRWHYWGIGLRLGMSFDWFLGKDIYFSGKYSTALLMGHYHNHAKQETNAPLNPGDDPSIPVRDTRFKDYRMTFTNQFLLGLTYEKSFGKRRIEAFAGYELTFWTNLQEVYRSTDGPPQNAKETWKDSGLIGLQGLTVRLSLFL